MLAIEARKMGYRIATFSPDSDSPTGQLANLEIVSEYEDLAKVEEFASSVDVVTFEFENVPAKTVEAASRVVPVHPRGEILHTTQNRIREKNFLKDNGFPVASFQRVRTVEDLFRAGDEIGFPIVLKTAGFGYDGKGQVRIESASDVDAVFEGLEDGEFIAEPFIGFFKEVSVVSARDERGRFEHYGIIENDHKNHILDVSFSPADVNSVVFNAAVDIARGIAEKFGYVGTMCVEYFLCENDELLVNEIAPRPHNSGHLTFSAACVTSQFEQQLRAVCGLPLGSAQFSSPVAMANLLGDLWKNGEPKWEKILASDVKLHLYGKREARPGRKMGHLIAVSDSAKNAGVTVRKARELLNGGNS